ncbi:MAG: hypothetical protein KatS3mg094_166 [Candidatus Parcubacteria bacterium]|nr:MAG: hypothetical protein KatS3mg094_166 [Candidatus Parcubacteria bacterium]
MDREEIVIKKIILNYLKKKDFNLLNEFILRLRKEGKLAKLKKNFLSLKRDLYLENGFQLGELELVFLENENLIRNKLNQIVRNLIIEKVRINKNIILGFILRLNDREINFNLENIIKK